MTDSKKYSEITEAIRAVGLSRSFGSITALDHLDLTVREGEIFGFVGPDGAGKTTTMRLLTAILDPSSGEGWVAGYHIIREAEEIKRHIGYMSQRFGLYPDLTVIENIHFYADIYGVSGKQRKNKIDQLLEFSGLTPFQKRLAGNLSGGMKQKLGLACALVHNPQVLFLDEPTNGVDPVSRRDFWRILYQLLREKVTIFISTAYLDEAERCSRLALIYEGKLLACDTPGGIKKLLPEGVVEIRCSQSRKAVALLRDEFGELAASLFGDRIHLVTPDITDALKQASELLHANGVDLVSSQIIDPTLEDVFVAILTQQKGTSADATISR